MKKRHSSPRKRAKEQRLQLGLPFASGTWGGARAGAGRPTGRRRYIPHCSRPRLSRHKPLHITLRVKTDVPSLRNRRFGLAFRRTLAQCCVRAGFRVIHYSIQTNHAHCIIEAADRHRLANGMKSFAARFARAVNRVFDRTGPVLVERYHLRILASPREVRHALAYVLLNARKHWFQKKSSQNANNRTARYSPPSGIDPFSSGRWFDGWSNARDVQPATGTKRAQPEVASANGWLLSRGWRRHRLIRVDEIPG